MLEDCQWNRHHHAEAFNCKTSILRKKKKMCPNLSDFAEHRDEITIQKISLINLSVVFIIIIIILNLISVSKNTND